MARLLPVVSTAYPYLRIRVDIRGTSWEASALLDTGFDGHLIIPEPSAQGLGMPDDQRDWQLADGSIVNTPIYLAVFEIVGLPTIAVSVTALGDEHILGRGVIDRFRVTFDHGKQVIVEL